MKLTKDFVLKINEISVLDASIRLAEFEKYNNTEPDPKHYDFSVITKEWPKAEYFDIQNIEGFCGPMDDKFVIMFRGSDSLLDWWRNFLFCKKIIPYEGTNPKIKVHQGFLKDYLVIRNLIHEKVKATNLKKVIVHGHSMGAAITTLCALDIQYNFPELEVNGIGLASPRIGNKYFKTSFNRRMPEFIRMTWGSDMVPGLPPKWFGFRHVGNYIHLGPEPIKCIIGRFKHHNIKNYHEAIKKEYN